MQQQLFETEAIHKKQGLIISKASKKSLTKNQEAFNKLTQRIERLHRDIEKKELQFETALKIYGNEFHPMENRVTGLRRQLVIILWDVYKSKKLSKPDQRPLKAILREQVSDLCTQTEGGPDEMLKKMFTELEGESFEKAQEREKEMIKTEIGEVFDEMGMDINFDDVDMNDQDALREKKAEIQQKLMEKQEAEQEQSRQRKQKKKKTAKRVENERMQVAVEEVKQKNISTIYKQLAKLFHPDLEHDEERRAEKEVLMKELTAAYEEKNLHTLLTLELKWIHKENDHLESLSEEKLSIYLQILREQARELEQEINGMFRQHRYQVLEQEFGHSVQSRPVETVKQHLQDLERDDFYLKRDLENFQSPHALRHIKILINEWKQIKRQNNSMEAEFIRMTFGSE